MSELIYRTARELLDGLAAREFSALELLDAHAERHARLHDRLNAVVATDLDRARDEAKRVDDARLAGEPLGPLAGLPMTVKDGFDLTGLPAVCGGRPSGTGPRTSRTPTWSTPSAGPARWCGASPTCR